MTNHELSYHIRGAAYGGGCIAIGYSGRGSSCVRVEVGGDATTHPFQTVENIFAIIQQGTWVVN
jgi:hypothetical protein